MGSKLEKLDDDAWRRLAAAQKVGEPYSPLFSRAFEQKVASADHSAREAWAEAAAQALGEALAERGIEAERQSISLASNGCIAVFSHASNRTSEEVLAVRAQLLDAKAVRMLFAKTQTGKLCALLADAEGAGDRVPLSAAWLRPRLVVRRRDGLQLSVLIGIEEPEGEIRSLDLSAPASHALIAGKSGAGKTTLIRTMLLDMAASNPSSRLKFCLIDPKSGLDVDCLSALPNMTMPIICDKAAAAALLGRAVGEMTRRYAL